MGETVGGGEVIIHQLILKIHPSLLLAIPVSHGE